MLMQNLQALLKLLIDSQVEFIIIGGFAAVLHGCNQTTRDIDICILHSAEQIQLLQKTLEAQHPRHRLSEQQDAFQIASENLSLNQDFHLNTDLGVLDVVKHVEGVGTYYDVLKNSETIEIYGGRCFLISIEDLIKSKKALGRHRDTTVVMELEAILKERNKV